MNTNKLLLRLIFIVILLKGTQSVFPCEPYERKFYQHWIDEDRDCQNARQEVLIAESEDPVIYRTNKDCIVERGVWQDPYSGLKFTDPSDLDIDHLVPLKEAHESGGFAWDSEIRREYANYLADPNHLIAVSKNLNRQKGASDPAEWLPPNQDFRQSYAKAWVDVKIKWGLTADKNELKILQALLDENVPLPPESPEMNCTRAAFSGPEKSNSNENTVICGSKKYCTQMSSCEEAKIFLAKCGLSGLDRNNDGVPCESLCR